MQDGRIEIAVANPIASMQVIGNKDLKTLANEVG